MNYWNEKLHIGNLSYSRFISGPLDGYTDSPFRRLVRLFSPQSLLYGEMRHVASVVHSRGRKALIFEKTELPLQFQITTNSLDYVAEAVELILQTGVAGIDLNIACPARNVVKSCSGSALMAQPELLKQVLTLLRSLVSIPLTVKMRAGFKEKNALDVVKLIADCGIDALAIHPRLQTEKFCGEPDYNLVAQVKKSVTIPVLYSGGIHTFDDAKQVYEKTGVDGFLIGRGMCGKPWKLNELDACAHGELYMISKEQIVDVAIAHLDYLIQYYQGEGLYNFRKHIPFYISNFEGASALRQTLITSESVEEVKQGLSSILRK